MRYNKSFEKDYEFYLDCVSNGQFMFCGEDVSYKNFSPTGADAKETFYKIDSLGKFPPTREPFLVESLLSVKKGLNLQIKQWAEGMADLTLLPFELQEWLSVRQVPEWVYKAVINQTCKIFDTTKNFRAKFEFLLLSGLLVT